MALARCENCGQPRGRGENAYSNTPRHPVNHPNSGVVCGKPGCQNAAIIWLLEQEEQEYGRGQRIFEITGAYRMAKFRVQ
jgi:hypothetical protein